MAIIFLPGIKGSELIDTYPMDWPRRWSLQDMVIEDVIEKPLDFALTEGRHDATDGHRMQPGRLMHYAYGAIVGKLRAWQAPEPLYTFSYDWRKPLELSAEHLVRAMAEISAREAAAGRSPQLKFVTHSMGALVLRAALRLRSARQPFDGIGRIVFIAPPFRGSIGAPYALVVGERDGLFGTDQDDRRMARGFPAVYQMTPWWRDAAVDEDGAPLDLFDPANWQANVRRSGTFEPRFLRDAGAFAHGRRSRQGGTSAAPMLTDAALAKAANDVLILCGSGIATPVSLPVQTRNTRNPNWFDFAQARTGTRGDGRVPLISAAVKGITLAAFENAGEHGLLCRDERIVNLASLWLEGHKALKMTRRGPQHSVDRAGRSHFQPWDGTPDSFDTHVA